MEQIICGNIRVQLLNDEIVRLEYSSKGRFCDENTFFIPNKTEYARTRITYSVNNDVINFGEYALYLPKNGRGLSGFRLEKNGVKVYAYKKLSNSGELPPLYKTPEVFALFDTPRIIIPEGGYSVDRKGEYSVEEDVQDVYLLLCKKDARHLRKLYVELTGKPELVRLSTLGSWNSKYYAYTEQEAKQLIMDYESHNVPLDNMVIDTDWRSCEHGWGYDVNTKLFPDIKSFLDFAHAHGVEIMFNDHPEPVEGANVFDSEEISYRERNLQSLMSLGLDTWWYDRNWGTHLISPTENIRCETFGLYLFSDITKHFYQKRAQNDLIYRRPVIMGNVVNDVNGDYERIYDSASHRYSIQWTGDTRCDFAALAQEVDTMLKASNNCVAYCNADCGGHLGNPDKEQFVRWMQFGTLSPVFRPHCTNTVERFREPWLYDVETLDIVREYVNLRYRLLPVIYASAYQGYQSGEPIFKSLGWNFPSDKKALKLGDEYMLGRNVLIKPVCTVDDVEVYLPAGKWLDVFTGNVYIGGRTVRRKYGLREMPLFVRLGALIPIAYEAKNTKEQMWDNLVFDFYPCKEAEDSGHIYEDDTETTAYKLGKFRKCAYEAKYLQEENAFVLKLHAAEGSFEGDKAFEKRVITLKYHLLDNVEKVKQITVNGVACGFTETDKNVTAFPLNTGATALDGKSVCIKFTIDVCKDYEIKIFLS